MDQQQYQTYIKEVTPKHSAWKNLLRAFFSGGLICTFAQHMTTILMHQGIDKENAAAWTLLILIALSAFLTGLGVFSRLASWGGAGLLVPITGFANSIASPMIEYRRSEGLVFGAGVQAFSIAGPVILYGLLVSWVLGVIGWLLP